MKALSIRQPWAESILCGAKDVENRSFATKYRGTIAVHASQTVGPIAEQVAAAKFVGPLTRGFDCSGFGRLSYGALVGLVDIVGIVSTREGFDPPASPWYVGPFGWLLANPRRIEIVRYRGRLGLFDVDDSLIREISP